MMLEEGLLGALCLGGGGWEDRWRTICLDMVAGGFDGDCIDTVGSSREEGAGLVDGGLADAHGGRVSCCLDPSLFGTVSMDFSALGVVLMLHNLTHY